jgi:type I restriction enzyme S subunit
MSDLPAGWTRATLRDVATWGSGGTPKATEPTYYGGGIPWAIIGDLNDSVVTRCANSITTGGLKHSSAKVVPPGTVLIAMYGSIGKLGVAGVSMATNQAIAFAQPDESIIAPRYLFWYLRLQRDALLRSGKGATQQNISQTVLKAWPIPLPPLAEQRQIVEVIEEQVSRLDAAGASLERAMRRVRLAKEFAFTSVACFDGASYSPLGDIADIAGGITKDSKRETEPGFIEVPYLRVANVQRGYIDLSDVTTIRVDRRKAAKLRLMRGDILFNEGGDRDKLGRGWVWEGQIDGCIHQNHVFRARVDPNFYEPKFVSLYGNSVGRQWFLRMGRQTTNLASLNLTTLKSFPIPRVPIEDQRRVVAETERQLSVYERIAAELDTALSRSLRLRRAVLETAFSGRLVARGETHSLAWLEAAAREARRRSSRRMGPDGVATAAAESEIRA